MNRTLLGLVLSLVLAWPGLGWGARLFDGTNDSLQSASTIDLTAYSKAAFVFWLWWDSFADDNDQAFEFGDGTGQRPFFVPNGSSFGGGLMYPYYVGNVGASSSSLARPSAAAWHQYVINLDVAGGAGAEWVSVYIDGTLQTLTAQDIANNTGNLQNRTLNVMSRNNASLFGAGRMAEFAIYGGINLNGTDATNLQTSLPSSVQAGSLVHYWKLCGSASPEPATVGSTALTVNGATSTTHPSAVSTSCDTPGSSLLLRGVGQ